MSALALALGTGVLPPLVAFVAAAALGAVHFATLRIVTDRLLAGDALAALALQAVRLILLGGALVGLAMSGPWPLAAGLAGLALGRALGMRAGRTERP